MSAATYEVGPGKQFSTIGQAPWTTLVPGDTVLIYWQSTPYREKWNITRQGTAEAPITVRGVLSSTGLRPVIAGDNAVTPRNQDYWNQDRGILKLGGSNRPANVMPKYITIENLDIRTARGTYYDTNGSVGSYSSNAASLYIEYGQNIVVRNCILRDSGSGMFVGPGYTNPSGNILIEKNSIYGNGNAGSSQEHNVYSEALNITYQYNKFGALKTGADGQNLKDRSAGLVIRYNWIEGGSRDLDLVDSSNAAILAAPNYRRTYVYGNVLVKPGNVSNYQVIHFGGDSGKSYNYRTNLYLYYNTIVSYRTDTTVLLNLQTNEQSADVRDNVIYPMTPNLAMSFGKGLLTATNNWIRQGYRLADGALYGTVSIDSSNLIGTDPMFENFAARDFRLRLGSPALNKGTSPAPQALPDNAVTSQYVINQNGQPRYTINGPDLGAFESH
ncbi:MAG: right-handed parallel beta-helix repeat-containing protein [Bryobacterales bacterium]|nr:right-handed parallel beta-helix repeat-containing protein [Bryobacterales bacterium]